MELSVFKLEILESIEQNNIEIFYSAKNIFFSQYNFVLEENKNAKYILIRYIMDLGINYKESLSVVKAILIDVLNYFKIENSQNFLSFYDFYLKFHNKNEKAYAENRLTEEEYIKATSLGISYEVGFDIYNNYLDFLLKDVIKIKKNREEINRINNIIKNSNN